MSVRSLSVAAHRIGGVACTVVALGLVQSPALIGPAAADMVTAQAAAGSAAHPLTFPPTSDCAFLGGDAEKRCAARRAGNESELAKVRSGEIKTEPPAVSSSGGTFQPLSDHGSLDGISESHTIAPAEDLPAPSKPFNPNGIGNPWAGTPYDNGTGIPPR